MSPPVGVLAINTDGQWMSRLKNGNASWGLTRATNPAMISRINPVGSAMASTDSTRLPEGLDRTS
jgi:hypothetical protein